MDLRPPPPPPHHQTWYSVRMVIRRSDHITCLPGSFGAEDGQAIPNASVLSFRFFLSYILLVLKSGPTVLILREIIYRYKMAIASGDVGDN